MRYGFVILHYLTDDDTIKCVNSILKRYTDRNYEIVIVDNYSNNGSIEKVEKEFKNIKNIHFIKNVRNLGFAKGNNEGYKYCRDILKCNNIIISNNDIIVDSSNIFERIELDVKKYKSGIIGPDIVSMVDKGHQNPMTEDIQTKKDIIKDIIKYRILLTLNVLNLYNFTRNKFRNTGIKSRIKEFNPELKESVQLHGSFIIFTNLFVNKMQNAFCNDTFLYMEETILKKICDINEINTLYDPFIRVYHKEDSSTNKLNNSSKKKRTFVFKNLIKSLKVLLKYQ